MKTCGYVELAKKLDKPKQDLILTAGILTIDLSSVDDEDGEDRVTDAAKDPCAFLEIWYGSFSVTTYVTLFSQRKFSRIEWSLSRLWRSSPKRYFR